MTTSSATPLLLPIRSADEAIDEFLSRLERREANLLSWGFVEGSFSYEELLELADGFLDTGDPGKHFTKSEHLIEALIERRLLYAFYRGGHDRYRTRMAETLRLMANLRQLFPKHLHGQAWQTASTLVADYRLLIRPRAFPRREIRADEAWTRLNSGLSLNDLQRDVWATLLGMGTSTPFRLRAFQEDAVHSVLAGLQSSERRAIIVCAGTGSGKTLAFYLPAFLQLAPEIQAGNWWVKCLAIYPRNELLKDQFSETYQQARRLDALLLAQGRRKLVIGSLFGAVPKTGGILDTKYRPDDWRRTRGGYVCPFLRCPVCEQELLWKDEDRKEKRERLLCLNEECSGKVEDDEIILTRERLLRTPPDILFTTTEMLNQRLSDSEYGRLFGVGVPDTQKIRMVLLDEAHTYVGVPGAQVALLLRRWRYASRSEPLFVGLSATLRDARRFFAQLVGTPEEAVEEIAPAPKDLEQRGMEYMVALRGDPAAGTSLLSTTIQTAMLLRRALDPKRHPPSEGRYGKKVFLFTDDLDVTNRLFFYLLDAEGLDSWGRPLPERAQGSLANLRSSDLGETRLRDQMGQVWGVCEWIGHELRPNPRMQVERTSSQDKGVSATADLVVATAALEVGFNDPQVGGVLQHKAPHEAAQFLQRKGRAGRNPHMRPWTVVVLSDYGRDRLTYQAYDALFDPELPSRDLPVQNWHVLRMQTVYAFMDWLGQKLRNAAAGRVWEDFSGPKPSAAKADILSRRQRLAADWIESALRDSAVREDLADYLQHALAIGPETLDALFFEPPRSLLLHVLPTILRRLRRGWQRADAGIEGRPPEEFHAHNTPLPEFIPRALFNELNVPEVLVRIDAQQKDEDDRQEAMRLVQAVREFAPGRVSRRFGIRHRYARHWIAPLELDVARQNLPLSKYLTNWEELGEFQFQEHEEVWKVRCVRPWSLHPTNPPGHIADTSNAFLQWRTQIGYRSPGLSVDRPSPSRWESILRDMRFFTHNQNSPLEVRRFAMASEATITFESGQQQESLIAFTDDHGDPLGVGFAIDVDGLVIRFRPPASWGPAQVSEQPEVLRGLRVARFTELVQKASELDGIANSFSRIWLAQVYLSALVGISIEQNRSLAEASAQIHAGGTGVAEVLDVIFQAVFLAAEGEDQIEAEAEEANEEIEPGKELTKPAHRQRIHHRLQELFEEPVVLSVLHNAASTLWETPDDKWAEWLALRFQATLGAAVLEAVRQLCPDLTTDDLILDLDSGCRPPGTEPAPADDQEIWITETGVGGGGVIEKLLVRYGEDPRRFFDLVTQALEPSEWELVHRQLTRLLEGLSGAPDAELRSAMMALRHAYDQSVAEQTSAFQQLLGTLREKGFVISHAVVAAIQSRIARPGSSEQTDALLHSLIHTWKAQEEKLGIEIDARVFAYLQSRMTALDHALVQLADAPGKSAKSDHEMIQWRHGVLMSLLWPQGRAVGNRHLSSRNPFAELALPERELVRRALGDGPPTVPLEADWRQQAAQLLEQHGAVILCCPTGQAQLMQASLLALAAEPVESRFLLLHPQVRRITREGDQLQATLELQESFQ